MDEPGGETEARGKEATVRPSPPAPDHPSNSEQGATRVTPPAKLAWWRRGWGVAVIAIVSLLVGVGIGGGDSSKTKAAATPTPAQIAAAAVTRKEQLHEEAVAKAAAKRAAIATARKERAQHAAEQRAAAAAARREAAERRHEQQASREEAARKKAEETKTYSGTGGENIGTIHVPTDSILTWECPPCGSDNFIISNSPNDENQIDVNTLNRTSGETHVDEGTYHDVEVNTEGEEWTIHIAPDE
jgi:rubrerythrin